MVMVDGKAIEDNLIPIFGDGLDHTVEVVMGAAGENVSLQENKEKVLIER